MGGSRSRLFGPCPARLVGGLTGFGSFVGCFFQFALIRRRCVLVVNFPPPRHPRLQANRRYIAWRFLSRFKQAVGNQRWSAGSGSGVSALISGQPTRCIREPREIQTAYGSGTAMRSVPLRRGDAPYFSKDLAENARRVAQVSGVKLFRAICRKPAEVSD